ncbi:gamma-glutamyltransferase [Pseudomonas sp. RTC3]|uniref:gamma-glutamyltransferase n=1 Tax=unclassified Pseudomonas TaxID=196821 RepID=UPI002AB508FC|nr:MULTISPECIES: gamma-glutamyltransferase [unclassified Pseudomonas]MEB0061970.1 gamma-glutamyltransferase [Pseudomonas sp. RTC3]MDY7567000.1 gamma-glutamyltransferase [Pseudomonas sp. 5C2]MEB0007732.1 gamma-glutamyltransferase [Pseudomonas sp. RTB2]MEB0016459.1 gamma-glutamyltransferase [Pseudomonas sp. RTB3]MEB0027650.1 gamma-glutamyltransferase [Pseudomonas sp. MH9.2]
MTRTLNRLPSLLGALLLLCALAAQAKAPQQAAIASPHPQATAAGREILFIGGNAFDAAVAVSAALAVVEPYASGLGGGGFFLLRQSAEPIRYQFLDARERAPLQANQSMYRRDGKVQPTLSLNGPLAAAIPGLPAALVELAEHYGKLPLKTSLAPAIRLAYQGFAVDPVYRERAGWRLSALRDDPESTRLFLRHGNIPALGEIIKQPELGLTLDRFADKGRAGFYEGLTGQALVKGVRSAGGIWTDDDLQRYRVVARAPLRFPLADNRELISAPPPSAGGIALAQSLTMLQQLPWREADKVQRAHYVVEVLRRAYRDRGLLGDPDFVSNPLAHVLDRDYLKQLARDIDPHDATPSASLPPAPKWREGDHTTHFAILDSEGNAVAATLSVNLPFGSAFSVPGTGVVLNNEMDDFAADPQGSNAYGLAGSQANAIAAGKRPLSSMSPSFIESPTEFSAFGTPGGSRIPSMVLLSILQYLDGQPVATWPAVPRYHHQYLPDVIEYEPDAFSPEQLTELQARGYSLKDTKRAYGNQQVLFWNKDNAKVEAASDPRGLGIPAVFDPTVRQAAP